MDGYKKLNHVTSEAIRKIKGKSAYLLLKDHSEIRSHSPHAVWQTGYSVKTIGEDG